MAIHIHREDYLLVNSKPVTIPLFVGQIAINTTNDEIFISKGTTDPSDWISTKANTLERETEFVNVTRYNMEIPININYVPTRDILNLYCAGTRLENSIEFAIDAGTIKPTNLSKWMPGDRMIIEVIRGIRETVGGTGGGLPPGGGGGGGGNIQNAAQVPLANQINGTNNVQAALESINNETVEIRKAIDDLKISRYSSMTRLQVESARIPINIPEFDAAVDTLDVYVSGTKVFINETFTIDNATNEIVCAGGKNWAAGVQIYLEVSKITK